MQYYLPDGTITSRAVYLALTYDDQRQVATNLNNGTIYDFVYGKYGTKSGTQYLIDATLEPLAVSIVGPTTQDLLKDKIANDAFLTKAIMDYHNTGDSKALQAIILTDKTLTTDDQTNILNEFNIHTATVPASIHPAVYAGGAGLLALLFL